MMVDMNLWFWAALCLLPCLFLCGLVIVRSPDWWDGIIALEMASLVAVIELLLIATGYQRPELYDLALAFAVLSFPGALVFVHFGNRHGKR